MKKFLAALLAFAALFTAVPLSGISAYALQNDEFVYELNGDDITLTHYKSSTAEELTVPSEIDGHPVTKFEGTVFSKTNKNLKRIIIPSTITFMSATHFKDCPTIEKITVDSENTRYFCDGNGILYEHDTYDASKTNLIYCPPKITKLTSAIPESVSDIEKYAFYGSSLGNISLPSNVSYFGESAFENSAIESMSVPDKVKNINYYCFKNCTSLKSIELNNVTRIWKEAFAGCTSLRTVTLPETMTTVEESVFSNSGLQSVIFSSNIKSIENMAFAGCTQLTSVELSSNLVSMGTNCFEGCTALENIVIPKSVTNIKRDVFLNCSSLNNIELLNDNIENLPNIFDGTALVNNEENYDENGVVCCGNYLVRAKDNITELKIKSDITGIAGEAFKDNTTLESVIIPDSVLSVGEGAFRNCTSLNYVYLSNSLKALNDYSFSGCTALKNIIIPESVTEIASCAFYKTGLEKITVPQNVKSLGTNSFRDCTSLLTVGITGATSLASGSIFNGCTSLNTVKIHAGTSQIGSYCFNGCVSLSEINIPEGVRIIDPYAFWGCEKINSIVLPKSIYQIYSNSFSSYLKTVYYVGSEDDWNKLYQFNGTLPLSWTEKVYNYNATEQPDTPTDNLTFGFSADGTLKISGSGEMGAYEDQSGFGWYGLRSEIKTVIFDEGVTSIAAAAFKGYENLSEVILCGTITDIGASAFENCGNLKFVTFKSSPAVGDNAFKNHNGKLLIIGENNNGKRFANNQNIKYLPVSYNSKKEALVFSKEITVYKDLGYYFITDFVRLHSQAKYLYFERLVFDGVLNEGDIDLSCVDDESNYLSFDGLYVSLVAVTENGKEQISFEQMLNLMKEGKYDAFKFVIAGHEETPLDRINERFENFFQDALKTVTRVINFFKRLFR